MDSLNLPTLLLFEILLSFEGVLAAFEENVRIFRSSHAIPWLGVLGSLTIRNLQTQIEYSHLLTQNSHDERLRWPLENAIS